MKEEIINELYLQSQIQRDTEWGENVTFFDYRKFAELIVQECKSVIDPTNVRCTIAEENHRYDCINMIDEHFGVK